MLMTFALLGTLKKKAGMLPGRSAAPVVIKESRMLPARGDKLVELPGLGLAV